MSHLVDAQRKEDALHARLERAKSRLRTLQVVVQLEVEGVSQSEAARRLGISRKQLSWLRLCVHLVEYGEAHAAIEWQRTGMSKRRTA